MGLTNSILSKNKKILQNFGQLAFFFNLRFSAFLTKKRKEKEK